MCRGVGLRSEIVLLLFFYIGLTQATKPSHNCERDYNEQQWEQALISCQTALKNNSEEDVEIKILDHLAHISGYLGDNQQTLHYDRLIETHPSFKTAFKLQFNWHRRKGRQSFLSEQYKQSNNHYNHALNIANNQKNLLWQSKAHNDLGVLLNQQGQFTEALSYYQQSLELKLMLGDDFIIANTQSNIGLLLLKLERPADAIEYLNRAIKSFQKYTDSKSGIDQESLQLYIDHTYETLVVAYLKLDEPEKVTEYINKIIQSKSNLNTGSEDFNSNNASTNLTFAQFYTAELNPQLAQVFLDKAMAIEPQNNVLSALYESSKIKILLNDFTAAIKIAKKGLKEAEEIDDLNYQASFNHLISQSLERDNPPRALVAFKAYHQAREAFLEQKYNKDIDTINFKIKSNQIERDLFEEQLINSKKEQRIIKLTNWILMALIGLIALFTLFTYFYVKKNKERQALLKSIEFHKQQWLLLNANQEEQQKDNTVKTPAKQSLKETVVKAMVEAVDVWNRHTGRNRIDLAEKSKIWTITIDNGVLRTRSMDKYLSIKQIPENPRWRKVVRTCHFILADSTLNTSDRKLLNDNLDEIMAMIKRISEKSDG